MSKNLNQSELSEVQGGLPDYEFSHLYRSLEKDLHEDNTFVTKIGVAPILELAGNIDKFCKATEGFKNASVLDKPGHALRIAEYAGKIAFQVGIPTSNVATIASGCYAEGLMVGSLINLLTKNK